MYTLTVDDRGLIVERMQAILKDLDPNGTHMGAVTTSDALQLAMDSPIDVAFLDVEMPGEMNGLTLGQKLKKRFPKLNIVIITGHKEYAISAFDLDASGYLLKPLTKEAVAHQLSVLRYDTNYKKENTVLIRCFGMFEALYNGVPLDFSYSKTLELLACLIDRKGALCTNDMLIGCLWPNESATQQAKARLRKYVKDLKDVFASIGMSDIIHHQERVGIGLDISKVDCDYYNYLHGNPVAIHQFKGEYMMQYELAGETRASLAPKNLYKS